MKKASFILLTGLLAFGLLLSGCKLSIENPIEGSTYTAYLGGETGSNLTVTSATLNGAALTGTPKAVTGATWNDYSGWFTAENLDASANFTLVMNVTLDAVGTKTWQKWSFVLYDDATAAQWYLRADAWSNDVGSHIYGFGAASATLAYTTPGWTQLDASETVTTDFHDVFAAGSQLVITVSYTASNGSTTVSVSKGGTVVYTATGTKA